MKISAPVATAASKPARQKPRGFATRQMGSFLRFASGGDRKEPARRPFEAVAIARRFGREFFPAVEVPFKAQAIPRERRKERPPPAGPGLYDGRCPTLPGRKEILLKEGPLPPRKGFPRKPAKERPTGETAASLDGDDGRLFSRKARLPARPAAQGKRMKMPGNRRQGLSQQRENPFGEMERIETFRKIP